MAPLPPLPCTASYTNLSTWNVDNSAIPEVQDAYITVVKHVMLREVALQGVSSLVTRCDEMYWKYANLKVDAIEKNKSGTGESFNVILRTLARLQEELAVALAHLRSLSVSVVEEVLEWRLQNRKNKMTKENISLYWKKENYLIKMLTDVTDIMDVPIIWMWMGCDMNPFLIPPKGHSPADSWRRREEMYQTWLKKHKEHVQRAHMDTLKKVKGAKTPKAPKGGGGNQGVDKNLAKACKGVEKEIEKTSKIAEKSKGAISSGDVAPIIAALEGILVAAGCP